MENNYYQIYLDANVALAKSIVIKSARTADAVNEYLTTYGISSVDYSDPTTWKYYLNVSGQYHSSDTVMTVTSLDTLQTIDFTSENLQYHKATVEAYGYGNTLYRELVARYPKQERLIIGILYPCNIDTAIAADEGTILSYPPHLVEDYEYSLIARLQEWIYGFFARWDNSQFQISDNLYTTTMLGVMYLNLVPALINLRLKACKTNEAHSYHVRQYLASHGLLDSYIRYMTRDQVLFLYRNIAYIERNNGKQSVFEWLVEHIMTQSNLPLGSYEMRHDTSGMPASLKPLLSFYKTPINEVVSSDTTSIYTADQVFDKEQPLARDNKRYRDEEFSSAVTKTTYSLSNKLKTKLLESSVTDYQGSEHYPLAGILLNQWIWMASKGYYKAYINFESPATGENIALTAKDAYAFYVYAFASVYGVKLTKVPNIIATRVIRIPLPDMAELSSMVNPARVSESFITAMRGFVPALLPMISVSSFYTYCKNLWVAAMNQYCSVCTEETMAARAQKEIVMERMWCDVEIQVGDTQDQLYSDWFTQRNIDISVYTDAHLAILVDLLLSKATGVDSSNAITMKDIQANMVSLMQQLSSYSVQYVTQINTLPIVDAPNATIRPDDLAGHEQSDQYYPCGEGIIDTETQLSSSKDYDLSSKQLDETMYAHYDTSLSRDCAMDVEFTPNALTFYKYAPSTVGIGYDLPELPNNPDNIVPVLGIDMYLALTPEQRAALPSIYNW